VDSHFQIERKLMKRSGFIIPFLVLALVFGFACTGTVHEEEAWKKALEQNTFDGYIEYIEQYPDGRYAYLFSLGPVANDQGISDAATYSPDEPGPHRLVILDSSGQYHLLNKILPTDWQPSSPDEVELVAVIVIDEWIKVSSRKYFDKNRGINVSIDSKRHEMDLEIREAKTGILLQTENLKGPHPGAFPIEKTDSSDIRGDRISPDDLKICLNKWVAADIDIGSSEPDPEEDWKKFSGSDFELYLPGMWEGGSKEQFELLIDKLKQKGETELAGAVEVFPPNLIFWAYSKDESSLTQISIYKESQIDLELDDFMESHYQEKAEKYGQYGWGLDVIKQNIVELDNFKEARQTILVRTSPDRNIVVEYLLKDGSDVWILTFSIDSEEVDKYIDTFYGAVETFSIGK
jgi:hypothetical protein